MQLDFKLALFNGSKRNTFIALFKPCTENSTILIMTNNTIILTTSIASTVDQFRHPNIPSLAARLPKISFLTILKNT